jgi:polysaccharide biosynthesis protein PslJ
MRRRSLLKRDAVNLTLAPTSLQPSPPVGAREDHASVARLGLAILGFFVLVVTLLPFLALPLPGLGAIPVAPLALVGFEVCAFLQLRRLVQLRRIVGLDRPLMAASGLFIALIALALALGVSAYGYTPEAGFGAANLAISVLVPVALLLVVRAPAELRMLVRLLIVGASLAGAIGLLLWALPAAGAERVLLALAPLGYPDGAEVIRLVYGTQLERATGTSVDANLFGGLMMLAAALVAGQLLARDALLRHPVLVLCFAIVLAALALSFSRSAWVGTGVALLYLGLFVERRALVVLALGAALMLAAPQMRERISGALTVQDAASVLRVEEYRDSVRLISEHSVLGVGFGPAYGLNLVRRVSNMYLLIGEEMGIAGLISLAVLLAMTLRRWTWRPAGAAAGAGTVAGLQAAVLAALVAGLFDHYFMNSLFPHTTGLFWLVVGLLHASARVEQPPVESDRRAGDRRPGEPRDEPLSSLA